MLRQMMNPDLYHGKVPWNLFEGWYFKIAEEEKAFSLIPGIFHGNKSMAPHAFIQVLDGSEVLYDYVRFPADTFRSNPRHLELNISGNRFSLAGMKLSFQSTLGKVSAEIEFSQMKKWNESGSSKRSMGYYNFIPCMECYSQVCLMDASVSGYISIDGRYTVLEHGRGYVEKNWGKQFPYSWIWVQSNNFSIPGVSLTASVGHIPFLLGSFRGFLIGLLWEDDFYSFTTMNHSSMNIEKSGSDVHITTASRDYTLEIKTQSDPQQFLLCKGPKDGEMVPLVRETISADVSVKLTHTKSGQVLFEGVGTSTGIEYGGNQMHILDMH